MRLCQPWRSLATQTEPKFAENIAISFAEAIVSNLKDNLAY